MALLQVGDVTAARRRLDRAEQMISAEDSVTNQLFVVTLGQGRIWAEQYELAQPRVDAVVEAARRVGAPMALSFALAVRSELEWWTGHWSAAYADAEESLRWAEELGRHAPGGTKPTRVGMRWLQHDRWAQPPANHDKTDA